MLCLQCKVNIGYCSYQDPRLVISIIGIDDRLTRRYSRQYTVMFKALHHELDAENLARSRKKISRCGHLMLPKTVKNGGIENETEKFSRLSLFSSYDVSLFGGDFQCFI